MRKTKVALAVTSALAAAASAQADTVLYGSARVSIDHVDDNGTKSWDMVNNDSLIGVRGEEDLGGGLSAVYQYQFIVDTTEGSSGFVTSAEPRYVGLSGGFGKFTVGTQETPYHHVGSVVSIFNSVESYSYTGFLGGSFDGFGMDTTGDISFSDTRDGAFTIPNSMVYATPDFNGFSAEAMFVTNGALGKSVGFSDGLDLWNVGAKYTYGPFSAGLSYISLNGDTYTHVVDPKTSHYLDLDLDQWIASAGYTQGPISAAFIYERGSFNEWGILKNVRVNDAYAYVASDGSQADDAQNWYLAGSYTLGNNVFKAAYGQMDTGVERHHTGVAYDDTISNYLLGYQYNFSKRTALWVEYIGRDVNEKGTLLQGDRDVFSIGTRVDF